MNFLSINSLLFLIGIIGINAIIPSGKRPVWILIGSFFFIALLSWKALLALCFLTILNFFAGAFVKEKKPVYYFSLFFNLASIVAFNYFEFRNKEFSMHIEAVGFNFSEFILAIGLSFYSIQHIAYLTDIRKGKSNSEKNLIYFMFCSAYFPKFLSGPLTKYQELAPFTKNIELNSQKTIRGFNRFLFGLFKKLVIADSLSPSVHSVFDFNNSYPGLTILIGAFLFTLQLYFDFSGYSDMAIGVSNMLGISLPENFSLPLRSSSISGFWRKWHMSLIRFFTEYIFYPISYRFRKSGKWGAFVGLSMTFLISGLWHGIGLTFFLWSLCHLIYLGIELVLPKSKGNTSIAKKIIGNIYVIIAVSFSNIFFRVKNTDLLLKKTENLFSPSGFMPEDFSTEFFAPLAVGWHQIEQFNFFLTLLFCIIVLAFERKLNQISNSENYSVLYTYLLIMLILVFGVFSNTEQFIYMQF